MATETYFNDFGTTLNGTINSSQTTLVVNSTSAYPNPFTGLQCHIRIDDEIMLVTAINFGTLTLTVTRAQESTAGSNHANGAQVLMILTAQGLNNIVSQSTTSFVGAQASLPGSYPVTGSTYWANDAPYINLWNGSSFTEYYVPTVVPPPALGSWTTVGGSISTANTAAGLNITRTAAGGNAGLFLATPATPYKIAMRFRLTCSNNDNNSWGGAYWLDSTSSPSNAVMAVIRGNSVYIEYNISGGFTTGGSYSAIFDPNDRVLGRTGPELNVVFGDDGTNRAIYHSPDGINYVLGSGWTRSRTDNLTPAFVGFACQGSNLISITLLSWRVF